MSEKKPTRLNVILREFNISVDRAVEYMKEKRNEIESSPNTKIPGDVYSILFNEFASDKDRKEASIEVGEEKRKEKEALKLEREKEEQQKKLEEEAKKLEVIRAKATIAGPKRVGSIDLDNPKKEIEEPKKEEPKKEESKKEETPKVEEKKQVKIQETLQPEEPKIEKKEKPIIQ